MRITESKNIKTVKDYLQDEIIELRNKPKKPIDIDSDKIENFIVSGVDCDNLDDICEKWNSLFKEGSEN